MNGTDEEGLTAQLAAAALNPTGDDAEDESATDSEADEGDPDACPCQSALLPAPTLSYICFYSSISFHSSLVHLNLSLSP